MSGCTILFCNYGAFRTCQKGVSGRRVRKGVPERRVGKVSRERRAGEYATALSRDTRTSSIGRPTIPGDCAAGGATGREPGVGGLVIRTLLDSPLPLSDRPKRTRDPKVGDFPLLAGAFTCQCLCSQNISFVRLGALISAAEMPSFPSS